MDIMVSSTSEAGFPSGCEGKPDLDGTETRSWEWRKREAGHNMTDAAPRVKTTDTSEQEGRAAFEDELSYMLVHQMAAPNSPQCSAGSARVQPH